MTADDVKRRLAAIMSADVKGYGRLMRQDETATVQTLTAYREIMTTLVLQHHGRVVDAPGDNLLAEFASVVDAVQGAVAIQRELRVRNAQLPENQRMIFRIGINLGDVIVDGDRIYGDGVNIAARLEGLAEPGGICISRTAYDQIEDKLPYGYEYLGEKHVKNISKPVRAYKVLMESEQPTRGAGKEKPAARREKAEHVRHLIIERRSRRRGWSKTRFHRHLRAYIGVIALLFIINLLTYHGALWFQWPALGWGLLVFFHWSGRFTAPRQPRTDMDRQASMGETESRSTSKNPKYLRVQVEPKGSEIGDRERVNVRIPIHLLKAGARISAILPEHTRHKINDALKEQGLDFDISSLDAERLDDLLESLARMHIDVDREDKKVRIFFE